MKKMLLAIILLSPVSLIIAAEKPLTVNTNIPSDLKPAAKTEDLKEQYCRIVLSLSETTMKAKQAGKSIKDTLEITDQFFKDDDPLNMKKMLKFLVMDAYNQPDFQGAEYKRQQLNDFTAKHYLACAKAM